MSEGGSSEASISGSSISIQVSADCGVVGNAHGVTTSRGDGGGERELAGGALLARTLSSAFSIDK
jgi:hypothetical protein